MAIILSQYKSKNRRRDETRWAFIKHQKKPFLNPTFGEHLGGHDPPVVAKRGKCSLHMRGCNYKKYKATQKNRKSNRNLGVGQKKRRRSLKSNKKENWQTIRLTTARPNVQVKTSPQPGKRQGGGTHRLLPGGVEVKRKNPEKFASRPKKQNKTGT